MEKLFKLKDHNTTVKTEVMAGITTFLTMAYILAVNPNLLSASGMDSGAVFTATALASALATFIMAFWANYPIALSAGMGLNAYFAFTVCLGDLQGVDDPWKVALAAVLVEGIIFIIFLQAAGIYCKCNPGESEIRHHCWYRSFHRLYRSAGRRCCCIRRFYTAGSRQFCFTGSCAVSGRCCRYCSYESF